MRPVDVGFQINVHRVSIRRRMLALTIGGLLCPLAVIVGWTGFCIWLIHHSYWEEGEDFWPSVGQGCAMFFGLPIMLGIFALMIWLLLKFLSIEIF